MTRCARCGCQFLPAHHPQLIDVLLAELPPKRLQILRELKSAGALSVYALAKRLGRNYSNVHGNIQRLLALGLAEKNATGQVLVPLDDIVIQVDASHMAAA